VTQMCPGPPPPPMATSRCDDHHHHPLHAGSRPSPPTPLVIAATPRTSRATVPDAPMDPLDRRWPQHRQVVTEHQLQQSNHGHNANTGHDRAQQIASGMRAYGYRYEEVVVGGGVVLDTERGTGGVDLATMLHCGSRSAAERQYTFQCMATTVQALTIKTRLVVRPTVPLDLFGVELIHDPRILEYNRNAAIVYHNNSAVVVGGAPVHWEVQPPRVAHGIHPHAYRCLSGWHHDDGDGPQHHVYNREVYGGSEWKVATLQRRDRSSVYDSPPTVGSVYCNVSDVWSMYVRPVGLSMALLCPHVSASGRAHRTTLASAESIRAHTMARLTCILASTAGVEALASQEMLTNCEPRGNVILVDVEAPLVMHSLSTFVHRVASVATTGGGEGVALMLILHDSLCGGGGSAPSATTKTTSTAVGGAPVYVHTNRTTSTYVTLACIALSPSVPVLLHANVSLALVTLLMGEAQVLHASLTDHHLRQLQWEAFLLRTRTNNRCPHWYGRLRCASLPLSPMDWAAVIPKQVHRSKYECAAYTLHTMLHENTPFNVHVSYKRVRDSYHRPATAKVTVSRAVHRPHLSAEHPTVEPRTPSPPPDEFLWPPKTVPQLSVLEHLRLKAFLIDHNQNECLLPEEAIDIDSIPKLCRCSLVWWWFGLLFPFMEIRTCVCVCVCLMGFWRSWNVVERGVLFLCVAGWQTSQKPNHSPVHSGTCNALGRGSRSTANAWHSNHPVSVHDPKSIAQPWGTCDVYVRRCMCAAAAWILCFCQPECHTVTIDCTRIPPS
jgi:hypothetical protein